MIEVTNFSPFAHIVFPAIDAELETSEVVVAKGTFRLKPSLEHEAQTFDLHFLKDESVLHVSDEYFGPLNRSSVRSESDLAPHKPKCDIVVIGSAHSPTGRPVTEVRVAVEIIADGTRVHHHSLIVYGERDIVRRDAFDRGAAALVKLVTAGSVDAPEWFLTSPEPFVSCPIRYELALGGELRVAESDKGADRLHKHDRLSDEARQKHPDGAENAPIAHRACRWNPVGRGFIEKWYVDAVRLTSYRAPRIEADGAPLTPDALHRLVLGRANFGDEPALIPQGFGVITRSWQPRLKLAGTYDSEWRETRWPDPPKDYDMAYWNSAHPAMQCALLNGGEVVTLTNLLSSGSTGTRSALSQTIASFRLPAEQVTLRLRLDDSQVLFVVMQIDTLTIDLEAMIVSVAWRVRVPQGLVVKDAALFELSAPNAPKTEDRRLS